MQDNLQIRSCGRLESWPTGTDTDWTLGDEDQRKVVHQVLDDSLVEVCPERNPVLLFSGGVDSGLLAARVAALGWRDALLVNYSFGDADPESHMAEAMAKHLGLRFRRDHGLLPEIHEVCPSIIHVPFVAPPADLEVTSHADVGILCYSYTSLEGISKRSS